MPPREDVERGLARRAERGGVAQPLLVGRAPKGGGRRGRRTRPRARGRPPAMRIERLIVCCRVSLLLLERVREEREKAGNTLVNKNNIKNLKLEKMKRRTLQSSRSDKESCASPRSLLLHAAAAESAGGSRKDRTLCSAPSSRQWRVADAVAAVVVVVVDVVIVVVGVIGGDTSNCAATVVPRPRKSSCCSQSLRTFSVSS